MNVVHLNDSPRIVEVADFLSADEIAHLREVAAPALKRAEVVDPKTGGGIVNDYRTGQFACMAKRQDLIVANIEQRIAQLAGVRTEQVEFLQLNKYEIGDEFKEHQDWLNSTVPGHVEQMKRGGQRIMSAVIYLNTPEAGGETAFTAIGLKAKPETGKLLLWLNVTPDMKTDHRVMHRASPVVKGEKWTITTWIRERAFDGSEEAAHEALKAKEDGEAVSLRSKLAEIEERNIQEGRREIMEICRKRKLQLYANPFIGQDGRIGATVELDPETGSRGS